MKAGEPVWQELQHPRGVSDDERRLLRSLTATVDEPLLDRQVDTAAVAAVCRCGCSSVRLRTAEPPLPAARVAQLSGNGRLDYFYVDAVGHRLDRATVQVVLHVVEGRAHELEVFAGEGVAVSLADLTHLTDTWVS